ncbi:MAG: hypothetical protein JRI23_14135 [Deltaproteobacteria bacterium]|jgi:hypothetical protein|nr:hypothetical protein [Deltaproteobacteria bacterium]MBW2532877.1 hypothetical protein [Deltaproteobacteria bacterium]
MRWISSIRRAQASTFVVLSALVGCSPEVRVASRAAATSAGGGTGHTDDATAPGLGGAGACSDGCGEHLWSVRFGDDEGWNEDEREAGFVVSTDDDGRVTLLGEFQGTLDLGGEPVVTSQHGGESQLFIASFERDGTHRWSRTSAPTEGLSFVIPLELAHDSTGNITGDFRGLVDFGGGALQSLGEGDGFLAKFGP